MRNLHGDGDCRCDPRRRTRRRAGFRQARLEALKAEINELRNEVEALKGDVAEGREEARGATGQMAAAKTEPPADAPTRSFHIPTTIPETNLITSLEGWVFSAHYS